MVTMAGPLSQNTADALDETLTRLSKKPGVRATIALDRDTGAILKTSGEVSSIRTSRTGSTPSLPPVMPGTAAGSFSVASTIATTTSADANGTGSKSGLGGDLEIPSETQGVEELSALVWNFIKVAGTLVDEIDREDELKLLRLRTRKQELVIVPDPKFLLIVVHDTPPA
ncbi:hypothetical protein MKZ38_007820 [Zalerion maritima]|uniref:Roadblock/LAMTOR2 domain-containing protein n=1 Tax=Zalerion maritima TaxID=339359 RepID=A0AAD5RI80_9PEZI|nr:hypothetical protein MKZ38_007820 [Zalerion maritima]